MSKHQVKIDGEMRKYIDVEPLIKEVGSLEQLARKRMYDTPTHSPAYDRYSTQYTEREWMLSLVKAQPAADVVEVRHGEWISHIIGEAGSFDIYAHYCNECDFFYESGSEYGYKYCPNCGARMEAKG